MVLSGPVTLDVVVGYVQLVRKKYTVSPDSSWDDIGVRDGAAKLDYYDGIRAALEHLGATFRPGFRRFGLGNTKNMKEARDFFFGGMTKN